MQRYAAGARSSPDGSAPRSRTLNFRGTVGLLAEGDGQWQGGGTNTGDEFGDMPYGPLPTGTAKVMRFTGTTDLKVQNGLSRSSSRWIHGRAATRR